MTPEQVDRYEQDGALATLASEVRRLQTALQEVVDVLGPQAGCGACCTGCQCEMALALEAAQSALGVEP